ncbi:MAG: S8/S53 family peptidase [Bacteroidota bacterium]
MKSILTFLILAFCILTASAQDFSKARVLPANDKRKSEVLANTAIVRFKTMPENSLLKTSKAQISGQFLKPEQSLSFNKSLLKAPKNSILSAQKISEIQRAEAPVLKTAIVTFEGTETPEEFCRRIVKENPNVEIAEPYRVARLLGAPNDAFKSQQEYLNTIHAYEAWDIFAGDTSMVIAISDNGILQTHEDLKNSIARNYKEIPNNGIDDDNNFYVDDYEGYTFEPGVPKGNTAPGQGLNAGHGTNVAGIAGATWNNGIGIAGVGAKCRIFPLKIAPISDPTQIVYGYQAIIYAAENNFKVINCSWGSPGDYSFIEQSFIDLAVARGVAIVAAAGNLSNAIPYYPANYRGVLGVGETQQDDVISNVSNYGAHVDIMAPGDHAYTTSKNDYYEDAGGGTSFASPMVAGMVALIQAKYPNLSPIQAIEFARHSVDDISDANPFFTKLIPGRMNLLKAMTDNPFDLASIRPLELQVFTPQLFEKSRLSLGDTALLKIQARNELGAGKNVKFVISVHEDFDNAVQIIQPEVIMADIAPSSSITIESFKIRITQASRKTVFFRVDMTDDNGYVDYFLLPFVPTSEVTTFKNQIAAYSVSDRGRLGFGNFENQGKEGVGFIYAELGNILDKGGLIIAQSPEKVLSAVENKESENEFTVVKPFTAPDENTGILNDANAGTKKIGIEATQYFTLLKDSNGIGYLKISLKNTSGVVLNDIAAGYFFDWDVESYKNNSSRLFPEAIPQNSLKTADACIVENSFTPVVAGCAVSTSQPGAEAQISVFNNNAEPGASFDDATQYESITSGTSLRFTGTSDIFVVAGMKFAGAWQPNEIKSFIMLFGAAKNAEELKTRFKTMLDSTFTRVNDITSENEFLKIYPQPARNMFVLEGNLNAENAEISVFTVDGRIVLPQHSISISNGVLKTNISTENLAPGMYFVKIRTQESITVRPFVVAH